jgi:hypothetical protein
MPASVRRTVVSAHSVSCCSPPRAFNPRSSEVSPGNRLGPRRGDGIALGAHEIKDDDRGGYEFHVTSPNPEGEPLELFRQLFEKMRRALAQKHLQRADGFGLQFAESGIVRGRVSSDPDHDFGDRVPMLVIDGEPISWKRFGQMLMTYEGFSFKLEVYDKSEERWPSPWGGKLLVVGQHSSARETHPMG